MNEREKGKKISRRAQRAQEKSVKRLKVIGASLAVSSLAVVGAYEAYHASTPSSSSTSPSGRYGIESGLIPSTVPMNQEGSFTTSDGTHYSYYNTSPYIFHVDAAKGLFDYYRQVFPEQSSFPIIDNGQNANAIVAPTNPQIPRTLYFLRPKDAASFQEQYGGMGIENAPRAQTMRNASGPEMTYIDMDKSKANDPIHLNVIDSAITSIAIEACQESVRAINPLLPNREDAQEILCNSFGVAYASRQQGLNYKQYTATYGGTSIAAINSPIIIDTQDGYNAIPRLQPLFTAK